MIEHLCLELALAEVQNMATREPGGSLLGIKIRELLLGNQFPNRSPMTEAFLFCSDRAEHVSNTVKPKLDAGYAVICDRYFYSSLAFQSYGRGLDLKTLTEINEIAIQGVLPDLVVLLDLDPQVGLERTNARAGTDDILETEALSFHTRVREGFLELADSRKENFLVLDASKDIHENLKIIRKIFSIEESD